MSYRREEPDFARGRLGNANVGITNLQSNTALTPTFFNATISPEARWIALYTSPYVPFPTISRMEYAFTVLMYPFTGGFAISGKDDYGSGSTMTLCIPHYVVSTTNTLSIPILVYVPDEYVHVFAGRNQILVLSKQDYIDGLTVIAEDRKRPLMPNVKHAHSVNETSAQNSTFCLFPH